MTNRATLLVICLTLGGIAELAAQTPDRPQAIARARVWEPTSIPAMNLRVGPARPDAFQPHETVRCDYLDKELDGKSAKFACRIGKDDEVKVKFGGNNGEVQGEVAATRLLWALGFGADGMYPVRVICRGCPESIGEATDNKDERLVDPAVIERKMPGTEVTDGALRGWSWAELNVIDEEAGGATRAHRDALRLLAVFLQHTDNKPEQQRLMCRDEQPSSPQSRVPSPQCARPLMMLNDVGLTFGRANLTNLNATGGVNLHEWSQTPVWKHPNSCVGNLPRSFTGTLKDPFISEEGRAFLAGLLVQLSDKQLRDLFDIARVNVRPRQPTVPSSEPATADEWVTAFKQKRQEILDRRCADLWSSVAPPLFGTGTILWLQSWTSPVLKAVANVVSLLGYTRVYIAIAAVLMLGYRMGAGAALLLLLALAGVMVDGAKVVVSLPRPDAVDDRVQALGELGTIAGRIGIEVPPSPSAVDADDGYGFPSGHVAMAAVFLAGLALFFKWTWAWRAMAVWVPLMALSRMYLGRHFPADVLGGLAVAIVAMAIALLALNLDRLGRHAQERRVAWKALGMAGLIAVGALWLGIPAAYDAGRLLGFAVGTTLLVHCVLGICATDDAALRMRAGRIAIAVVLYPLVWWLTREALEILGIAEAPLGAFIAGALPPAILLTAPFYIEQLKLLVATRRAASIVR